MLLTKIPFVGWKENAMRHCIWQCLLTYYSGWTWANLWGWAHEKYSSTLAFEKKIDLRNNDVGRALGVELRKRWFVLSPSWAAHDLCLGAWDRGWLWTRRDSQTVWSNGGPVVSRAWRDKYVW